MADVRQNAPAAPVLDPVPTYHTLELRPWHGADAYRRPGAPKAKPLLEVPVNKLTNLADAARRCHVAALELFRTKRTGKKL